MSIIKNRDELLSHGNVEGRKIVLDVLEYALEAIGSSEMVRKLVSLETNILKVGTLTFDLSKIGDIYVVGAGKGVSSIAETLEDILGDKIKKGLVIEKKGQGRRLRFIDVIEAGHPVPDEEGVRASRMILEIVNSTKESDVVFACVTGGCSALMTLPAKGISLEDVEILTNLLLLCGAEIQEINTVRKHISEVMGGRLAMKIHPAELVSLIVVDEVAGLPWGPTVPDTTTFRDALYVLKKYHLWEKVPASVRKHLETGDPKQETPKRDDFERARVKVHNLVLASGETVCEAARKRTEELGCSAMILSTVLEGESREAGIVLSGIAKEVETNNRPINPPCALIVGGETTVTIVSQRGEGGRNQEFALAASLKIEGSSKIVIASIGTDGTDGPTDIAGAIVDGYTMERAGEMKIEIFQNLSRHNSSYVFRQLNDAIFTGSTETNVMDLRLLYVGK
jgi:glycerate-2-kinase